MIGFDGEDQQVAAVEARDGEEIDDPQLQRDEGDEHEEIGKAAGQRLLGNAGDLHGPGEALDRYLALDDLFEGVEGQEHQAARFLEAVLHGGDQTVVDLGGGDLHVEADDADPVFVDRRQLADKAACRPAGRSSASAFPAKRG